MQYLKNRFCRLKTLKKWRMFSLTWRIILEKTSSVPLYWKQSGGHTGTSLRAARVQDGEYLTSENIYQKIQKQKSIMELYRTMENRIHALQAFIKCQACKGAISKKRENQVTCRISYLHGLVFHFLYLHLRESRQESSKGTTSSCPIQ